MKEQNTGEVDGLRDAVARALIYLDDECTPETVTKAREILESVVGAECSKQSKATAVDSLLVDTIRKSDDGSGEFALSDIQATEAVARYRESTNLEAVKSEQAYIAELRLVIKYAIEKDSEDGYTMHPDIVERLKTALEDTAILTIEPKPSKECPDCHGEGWYYEPREVGSTTAGERVNCHCIEEEGEPAEPESYEDARDIAERLPLRNEAVDTLNEQNIEYTAREIETYATQVADKLAKALREVVIETARFLKARQDKSEGEFYIISRLESVLADRPDKIPPRPRIVCLCGSTRFIELFATLAWTLERDLGVIVLGLHLLPASYDGADAAPDHMAEAAGKKEHFDELHKRKIDFADEILVLNVGGYIGESTRSEIAYAEAHGKPVRYLEDAAIAATEPKP